ncbi:methyl-accepting chemotaxis protein [Marinobacterium arenosum]|uniref:methyl-accepting chemotaxis protein n=1 Tax=Marinobacterium arenosum TaxID=2862496 RepID=UPI001C9609DA|nr:methyl-accepting chemotaxis protein [Marinobacterium arenosum]MBY4676002.1 methyl-accepting chemotaxis protein [Marinobacterium arenosum]
MHKAHTIKRKLQLALLVMGLVPLLIAILIASLSSEHQLSLSVYHQLTSIREIKRNQIQSYFQERQRDLQVLAGAAAQLQMAGGVTGDRVSAEAARFYSEFQRNGGYHDLFLISPAGQIFYSVAREPDYDTNLLSGPYADSNLAELFRRTLADGAEWIADFARYAPSNNEPAAFVAQPVKNAAGQVQLVVALQLSLDDINGFMALRDGLGESGETYLVGADGLMRSDSYLDPTHHSVTASFANPHRGRVDSEASRAALAGRSGTDLIVDYNGQQVLSSFAPLGVEGLNWALLAEMDEAQAFAPVRQMQWLLGLVFAGSVLVIILAAGWLANSLVRPLQRISLHMRDIAEGDSDLTVALEVRGGDEIAQLAGQFNTFVEKIRDLVGRVAGSTQVLADTSQQMSSTVMQTQSGIDRQQQDTTLAATAINQMTASIAQVAASTSDALAASMEAQQDVEDGLRITLATEQSIDELAEEVARATAVINQLQQRTESISTVLEVINDIADQTNLLALNAAIEAARAGDAGRGFSVVADEVRGLAQRTQSSTEEIQQIIGQLQSQALESVQAMESGQRKAVHGVEQVKLAGGALQRINAAVNRLAEMNTQIASAAEQQSHVSEEINRNIVNIEQVARENADGARDTQAANDRLSELSAQLKGLVGRFKLQ